MSSSSSVSDILNSPLHLPPKGQQSNFIDPKSNGGLLIDVCSPFLVLTIIFFSARLYGRLFITRKPRWDDLTCTIGFLLTVALYVLCIISVKRAYNGYHSWDVKVGQLSDSSFYLLSYLEGAVCPAALGFIKLTFFILYMQLFKPLQWIRRAIWFGAISSTIFYILIVTLELYFSTPRKGETFATHLTTKLEENEIKLTIPQAAISVFFDLYILILPLLGIYNLQLNRKQKVGVSLVFLTGGMACICSILTLYYRVELQTTDDILSLLIPTLITSLVELQIGVICACAPTLGFVVRKVKDSSTLGSKRAYASGYAKQESTNVLRNHFVSFEDRHTPTYTNNKGDEEGDSLDDLEMGRVRSGVRTYIGNGNGGVAGRRMGIAVEKGEEDKIRLTYEVTQERDGGSIRSAGTGMGSRSEKSEKSLHGMNMV